MIERIIEYVTANGREGLDLGQTATVWHYLMGSGGAKKNARITFLLFADKEASPSLVARFYRDPALNWRLSAEHRALTCLLRESRSDLRSSLPRPLAVAQLGDRLVMFEPPLDGVPLSQPFKGRKANVALVAERFVDAARWLVKLHSQAPATVPQDVWRSDVERSIARFARDWSPLAPEEEAAVRRLRDKVQTIDCGLPYGWSHGDFCHKNVLRAQGGQLQVLDWQYVSRLSFFGHDLAHFPLLFTQWALARDQQLSADWFQSQFTEPRSLLSPALRRYFETYLRGAGLPPTIVDLVLPLGIIRQVLRIGDVSEAPYAAPAARTWREALTAYGRSSHLLPEWTRR